MTTRGLVEDDMAQIADWMHQAVEHREDAARLEELRTAVREFAVRYPLPSDK
jgi:glycine hydroxymethyltransferase